MREPQMELNDDLIQSSNFRHMEMNEAQRDQQLICS